MHPLDWAVIVVYFVWIVYDGLRRSKNTDKVEGYFLANRSLPWWAVGLSVMATQMSAVTMVATTGQGYLTGLRFVQFYFGLPLAMIILSLTVVPFFTRARVYTAYEYLERRFDAKTRSLASFLFLIGRAASLGVTLAAPSVVMSAILGWTLPVTVLVICVPMIVYTTIGGVQVFVFYLFQAPPLLFNHVYDSQIAASAYAGEYASLQQTFEAELAVRRGAAERNDRDAFLASDARVKALRAKAVALVKQASG